MADSNTTVEILKISKEAYQLADTTIKIGVPIFFALITSLVTWFFTLKSTKKNHEHELTKLSKNYEQEIIKLEKSYENDINKTKLEIKIKMIEDSMEMIEEHFSSISQLKERYINAMLKGYTCTLSELAKKDLNFAKTYTDVNKCFKDSLIKMVKVSSKFKLIGFDDTVIKLASFNDYTRLLNNEIKTNKKNFLNHEEYETFTLEYEKLKNEFYETLHADFEKLK